MVDSNHKDRSADATVLLNSLDVRSLADAFRGANITITRLEHVCRDLIKSNKELIEELKKGRRQGKKDRRDNGK